MAYGTYLCGKECSLFYTGCRFYDNIIQGSVFCVQEKYSSTDGQMPVHRLIRIATSNDTTDDIDIIVGEKNIVNNKTHVTG